jgi:hypothetical protein
VGSWDSFRWPPKSWLRAAKRVNQPYRECLREYYAKHPEHAPPPGWNYATYCAEEARAGYPAPLIGFLQSGGKLNAAALDVIVEALRAKQGKRGADELRKAEMFLIAEHVESLIAEGETQKRAVAAVMEYRECSRRQVYKALRARRQQHDSRHSRRA